MKSLKKIKQHIRLFLANIFGIELKFSQKNIYKNKIVPDSNNINAILESKGVLHIGAHRGSERYFYDFMGKPVIWIEANPYIFKELKLNLKEFRYQKAYNLLLLASSNEKKDFYLSSNDHASSSIHKFSNEFLDGKIEFQNIKRDIKMENKIVLISKTLDEFIIENIIEIDNYNHWVIDVQGAEIEVLKGANKFISKCKSITIEVSTEEFYKNSSLWNEVKNFLVSKNFTPIRDPIKNHDDILFIKK